jgi:PAS domain S-box-containing protein/putative nucleotidyltransferase with HDIG domain
MLMLSKEQKAPSDWLAKAVSNVLSIIYRRKLAEAGQRESEHRFHSLAEMLPQPIYECDLTGRITYANRKAFETFGYAHHEPDLNVLNFIAKSSHEAVMKSFQHMAQDPAERHREYLAQRKDGSTFPVLAYSAPILQGSKPVGLRGVLVDFTELKTSEDALRASEEKFRSIIEQSSDGFMLANESGQLLEVNQAFEQIYGMTRQELLGKPFWEMTKKLNYVDNRTPDPLGDAKKHLEEITQKEVDNQTIRQESEFITPDGRRRVIQRTAFPVKMSQGLRMAAVVSDITERKDAEREQQRLTRRLAMLSECNQSLIRMDRDEDLLRAICKTIVQLGDYRYAWIGMAQEAGLHKVIPVISYGDEGDYMDQMIQCDDPDEHCLRSYILECIQTLRPTIIDDIRAHPDFETYREDLIRYGFISMMIFPLTSGDELFGSLNIYSASAYTPDSNELDLLTEMANDVSFGIHARRMHIARDRAEQKALQANIELHEAYEATLEGWSRALELRERETAGHSQRVVNLTQAIARKMGLPKEDFVHIRRGALLHDIGKMGIPDHILLKPEPLTDDEWVIMRQHPQLAFNLLAKIPYLAPALDIPYCHHEHWDGSGYPRGLKGEEIPLAARIFMVVDIWDALTFDRPYRPAWTKQATTAYLITQSGTHLDPQVVDEFLKLTDPTELIASPSKEA